MKPPLIDSLQLKMSDKSSAVRLAHCAVLGAELRHLQEEHGYAGGGAYWAHRDKFNPGDRMRWADYCMAVAGISDRTAAHYYKCHLAVMARLRCHRRDGWKDLHRKMEMQPSTMTAVERADMIESMITLGLCRGDTQQRLLREYGGAEPPALETDRAKLGESGDWLSGISLLELTERYPDVEALNNYTWAKTLGMEEKTARDFVAVMSVLHESKRL